MPYPGDALTRRRLNLATPLLGDASPWRRPCLATPQAVNLFTFIPWAPLGVPPYVDFDFDFGQRPGTGRYSNYTNLF